MGVAAAICPEPFPCPGRLHVPTDLCKCREKAAGLLGSNLSVSPAALKGSLTLFIKPDSRGACGGTLGCWLGSAPSSSGFKPQPALGKFAWSGVASPVLLKQKADFLLILKEEPFTSREQHLLLHSTAPFPLRCSITGIPMVTDRDVTGVGSSTRDSDFIVPLKLGRAGARSGELPKPPEPRVLTKPCR